MKKDIFTVQRTQIKYLGGCHIIGWPLTEEQGFPAIISQSWPEYMTSKVSNLPFTRLHEHINGQQKEEDAVVVFQLGNYEFSNNLPTALRHTLGLKREKRRSSQSVENTSNISVEEVGSAAAKRPSLFARLRYNISWRLRYVLVSGLYLITWLLLKKHKVAFKLLNQSYKNNTDTLFVFLSPFPTLGQADNLIRKLGGWIIKRRMDKHNNLVWVDTHALLVGGQDIFADSSHLNEKGHRIIAKHLSKIYSQHIGNPLLSIEK